MRWCTGNNADQEQNPTTPKQEGVNNVTPDVSSRLSDADEQDYPDHRNHDRHYEEVGVDYQLDDGGCAISASESLSSSHHHHVDEFEELVGDLTAQQQAQTTTNSMNMPISSNSTARKSIVPTSSASSLVSSLPPPDSSTELSSAMVSSSVNSSDSGGRSSISASLSSINGNQSNVSIPPTTSIIENQQRNNADDDDPGQDHAVPDEGFEALSSSTVWRPQSQQSTCEFTHTIKDYSSKRESGCKKAEYSSTTVDSFGNRWRLIVYVNGNGRASNHHLSLFLQVADADELPFGWKKAVSYVLTLEHPSGPNLGYAKRNPDKTFKLCPKAIDWGWSQFITSDRIQQEGYISNDSLTVRAAVTVKSSSISIDPEDAELYLKCAVEEGNADAVEACLEQGAGVNCQFKDDLYTPLHTACSSSTSNGSLEVLKLLLKRGADGNACNKWRETPLLIAANNGHRAAVEALLENGADPSMCSEAGWSALTFAAHKGYDDIVSLLLSAGAPVNCRVIEDLSTPLHKACAGGKQGHLSAVKQLLSGGADVHALNKWRETPLLTAANHGQAAAVEALLVKSGDPCKCTDTGWSPLSIAAYKGHDDVVRLLLEQGAPTEEADPTLSALLQAATKGLPETVELLLRHGADHTVTTKKGDTALSILVEQNLIDAAVEMVTEYKASVPRCSRDRKKVQRARLLINLRVKQQKEGLLNDCIDSDDDDCDQDDSDDGSNSALHDSDTSPKAVAPVGGPKKKKKKRKEGKSRESAEAEARAAEEALLLELEQEDAKAQKDEAAATSRRNKKKKRKERERQQKLEEERMKKEKEEKEAAEREVKRLKEEKEKKEREDKAREQQEKEMLAATEKALRLAAKRKEKEKRYRERSAREKKNMAQQTSHQYTPSPIEVKEKVPTKAKVKKVLDRTKNEKASEVGKASTRKPSVSVPVSKPNIQGNRGWEIKKGAKERVISQYQSQEKVTRCKSSSSVQRKSPVYPLNIDSEHRSVTTGAEGRSSPGASVEDMLEDMANGVVGFLGFDSIPNATSESLGPSMMNEPNSEMIQRTLSAESASQNSIRMNGASVQHAFGRSMSIEIPAVSYYREKKVTELFHKISVARSSSSQNVVKVVDDITVRSIIYRWIVRASNESHPLLDPVIPSWTDTEMLIAFFQRQLIAGNCRGGSPSGKIEVLKEAGSFIAELCFSLASDVSNFRNNEEKRLPKELTDKCLNLSGRNIVDRSGSCIVAIDWSGCSEIYLPEEIFSNLRNRYCGASSLFLASIYAVKKRCDTKRIVTLGTNIDTRLSQFTLSALAREMNVSMELCSDALSVFGNNTFCSLFPDVEAQFGAFQPFGSAGGDTESRLLEQGGSVVLMPPLESNTTSVYMKRVLDYLELSVPLSFVIILPIQCFRDLNSAPMLEDLNSLDPRLFDVHNSTGSRFIRHVEAIPAGQHMYSCGDSVGQCAVSQTGSLLLFLQNDPGRFRFSINDASIANIKQAMASCIFSASDTVASISSSTPIGFQSFMQDNLPTSVQAPAAPYGMASGSILGNVFHNEAKSVTRRRERPFELADDGDDDYTQDVDVVSGMLNNLGMSMFESNPSQDVDIEAISLMGIKNPRAADHSNPLGQKERFG